MGLLEKITKKSAAEDKKDTKPKAAVKKADKKPAAKKTDKPASADKKDEKKAEKKGTPKKATGALFAYDIIREPVLTEKSDRGQMNGKYTFYVSLDANKVEIARAIKELYGVKPVKVRVANLKGKAVRFGRTQGKRKNRKKAVITLKQGDIISVTE